MYNDIPACMIEKAYFDCLASVEYKCFQAEFKDKYLSNGLLPDEFKDDIYEVLNSRMNKANAISKAKNQSINKEFAKEIKAYRKAWRDKTMMQPLIKAEKILAQDMYNHGIYDFEKFKVEFLKSLKSEYEKQVEFLATC